MCVCLYASEDQSHLPIVCFRGRKAPKVGEKMDIEDAFQDREIVHPNFQGMCSTTCLDQMVNFWLFSY